MNPEPGRPITVAPSPLRGKERPRRRTPLIYRESGYGESRESGGGVLADVIAQVGGALHYCDSGIVSGTVHSEAKVNN